MKSITRIIVCLAILTGALLVNETRAATAIVTRSDDRNLTIANCPSTAGFQDCSLREAITFVNSNPGADVIQFQNPNMTVNLTLGELVIGATLTIDGNNATVQRSTAAGTPEFRLFFVNADSLITINNLTVRNGRLTGNQRGGGIFVSSGAPAGNLTLNNCAVTNNQSNVGGGIVNSGVLTLNNSSVSGNFSDSNGGGIRNDGTLTLQNTAVNNNRVNNVGVGGGIYNTAGITINGGSISGNTAFSTGGGINNVGFAQISNVALIGNNAGADGGGIYNNTGTIFLDNSSVSGNVAGLGGGGIVNLTFQSDIGILSITNSTISGNTACSGTCPTGNGGGILTRGVLNLTNVTVTNNTASISGIQSFSPTTSLRNTIVAGNRRTQAFFDSDVSGASPFVSLGNNLIGNVGNAAGFGASGDIIGTNANPIDARLRPLGNYGGATETQPPFSDSPAVDAGNNCVLTANGCGNGNPAVALDQRGRTRFAALANSMVDIGAVELQTGLVTDGGNAGIFTLRDRAADPTIERILFFSTVLQVNLTSEILINRPLDIVGNGAMQISGQNLTRVFNVGGAGDASFVNLQITQGNAGAGDGGGILNQGKTRLAGCILSGNRTTGLGGGLRNTAGATASVSGCAFSGNQANIGGAINSGGTLDVSNSTFTQNTADFGAGINTGSGATTLTHVTIAGNTANNTGGGIRNTAFALNFTTKNTIVAGNNAPNAPDAEGFFTSSGNNLIGKTDGSSGFTDGTNGDIAGTISAPVAANLGTFANYGGQTPTMPPLPSSRAINNGNGTNIAAFDQRGIFRNIGGATDIGAVEYNLSPAGNLLEDGRRALPTAQQNVNYSRQLEAFGGDGVFTFSVTAGALPNGVSISQPFAERTEKPAQNEEEFLSTATLSGLPTVPGVYQFTVTAANAANPALNVSNNYTLQVLPVTSANVSVGGRVADIYGQAVSRAIVTLTDASGAVRTTRTNSFGFYRFENVPAGATYIVAVQSKSCVFAPQVVTVTDAREDLDFTGVER